MSRRVCTVEGCGRFRQTAEYCEPHARRVKRYGNPHADIPISNDAATRRALEGVTGLTAPEVCERTGASYRQMDYWTTLGIVTASIRNADGSGSARLYSDADAEQVSTVVALLGVGVSLDAIGGWTADQRQAVLAAIRHALGAAA